MKNIESHKLKSVTAPRSKFDACCKEFDYITVTEWSNGEGYDIDLNGKLIQLHYTDIDAINYLTKYLEYDFE